LTTLIKIHIAVNRHVIDIVTNALCNGFQYVNYLIFRRYLNIYSLKLNFWTRKNVEKKRKIS